MQGMHAASQRLSGLPRRRLGAMGEKGRLVAWELEQASQLGAEHGIRQRLACSCGGGARRRGGDLTRRSS